MPSLISKYACLILFFERYSFAGSQSGQYLLPNTITFFIFIAPILNYIYLLLYMKKGGKQKVFTTLYAI